MSCLPSCFVHSPATPPLFHRQLCCPVRCLSYPALNSLVGPSCRYSQVHVRLTALGPEAGLGQGDPCVALRSLYSRHRLGPGPCAAPGALCTVTLCPSVYGADCFHLISSCFYSVPEGTFCKPRQEVLSGTGPVHWPMISWKNRAPAPSGPTWPVLVPSDLSSLLSRKWPQSVCLPHKSLKMTGYPAH